VLRSHISTLVTTIGLAGDMQMSLVLDINNSQSRHQSGFYRPSIDVERVRTTWMRAERYFQALKRRDARDACASYGPAAICESDILGEMDAKQIERAISRMLAVTPDFTLSFQIESAGVDEALVNWFIGGTLHATGRQVTISGATELTFGQHGILHQIDRISARSFARQALGPKALLLCLVPGWRHFIIDEMRKSLEVDEVMS
jgi:hypothetical protein